MSQFSQVETTNVPAVKESAENMAKQSQGRAYTETVMPSLENQQAYQAMENYKCVPMAKMLVPDLEITDQKAQRSGDDGIIATPKDSLGKDGGPKDGGLTEGGKKGGNIDGGPKDNSTKDSEGKHSLDGDKSDLGKLGGKTQQIEGKVPSN